MQLFLDMSANVNAIEDYHSTELQTAACYKWESLMKLLLNHEVNINIQNDIYKTALESAVKRSYEKIVKILLKADAKKNQNWSMTEMQIMWQV